MATNDKEDLLSNVLASADEEAEEAAKVDLSPLREEIDLIQDPSIHEFVEAILTHVPSFFWTMPATFDSDHFPPDARLEGGNVLHTKRVVRIVAELSLAQQRAPMELDYLIAAAILHSCLRGGVGDKPEHTDFYPFLLERFVLELRQKEKIHATDGIPNTLWAEEEDVRMILRLVRCHLGAFSAIPEVIPLTTLEWILHMAVLLASRLHVIIDGYEETQYWRWINVGELPDPKEA